MATGNRYDGVVAFEDAQFERQENGYEVDGSQIILADAVYVTRLWTQNHKFGACNQILRTRRRARFGCILVVVVSC